MVHVDSTLNPIKIMALNLQDKNHRPHAQDHGWDISPHDASAASKRTQNPQLPQGGKVLVPHKVSFEESQMMAATQAPI